MLDAVTQGGTERRYICPSCDMKWFTLGTAPGWDRKCGRCGAPLVAFIAPPVRIGARD